MLIRDAHPDEYPQIGDIRVGAYLADGFLSPDSRYAPMLRELGSDGLGPVLVAVMVTAGSSAPSCSRLWPKGGEVVRRAGRG